MLNVSLLRKCWCMLFFHSFVFLGSLIVYINLVEPKEIIPCDDKDHLFWVTLENVHRACLVPLFFFVLILVAGVVKLYIPENPWDTSMPSLQSFPALGAFKYTITLFVTFFLFRYQCPNTHLLKAFATHKDEYLLPSIDMVLFLARITIFLLHLFRSLIWLKMIVIMQRPFGNPDIETICCWFAVFFSNL